MSTRSTHVMLPRRRRSNRYNTFNGARGLDLDPWTGAHAIDARRRSDAPPRATSPEIGKTCGLVPHGK